MMRCDGIYNVVVVVVSMLLYGGCYGENNEDASCIYSNHFAVEVDAEENQAMELANHHGFRCLIRVFEEENIYDFIHLNLSSCLDCPSEEHLKLLQNDPKVKWVEQQIYRQQIIRRVIHDKQVEMPRALRPTDNKDYVRVPVPMVKKDTVPEPPVQVTFNDPCFNDQWYLHNEGQTGSPPGNDLNVVPVWKAGLSGKGITLSVLDDGLQHTNPDLHLNYEPSVSYNLVDFYSFSKRNDPMPDGKPENSHGTYCAGVIAAVANNTICGVGVAFHAKVGGIRVLDGPVTDMQEALALSLGLHKVDIYSASWGPQDDGKHVAGPGKLAARAFEKGVKNGRGGLGAIYVWAVGNGGLNQDNCNLDGYVASMYTLAVAALTDDGLSAYYSEPCACTLVSTFVGGLHKNPASKKDKELWMDIRKIKVVVPELDGECLESFQGTSAAAPLAAGVIALALEANPKLSWRDVQHIVAETARIPTSGEPGWQVNGAGYHFHLGYGFGVMDAARMVSLAQRWRPVSPMITWDIKVDGGTSLLQVGSNATVDLLISQPASASGAISHLEYAVLTVDVKHRCRGNLEIFFISPAGTESQVLTRRPNDCVDEGFDQWGFMSVHFWGEKPTGKWSVRVTDHNDDDHRRRRHQSSIRVRGVTLHGTSEPWMTDHLYLESKLGKGYRPTVTDVDSLTRAEKELKRQTTFIKPNATISDEDGDALKARLINKRRHATKRSNLTEQLDDILDELEYKKIHRLKTKEEISESHGGRRGEDAG